ncbi:transcription factor IIA, alpha/beta subunit [Xylariomycetidae sp. FL0641]|nr:transcription factor IIA, alpha/beta subunit [Xylariomycetidae sp. FL0641]
MSNAQVGNVYQQIINDVIEASRVDFEESGVDEVILDELKKGWQKKLTQQQLASFPWDPKPDPPPAPAPAATTAAPAPQPVPASSPPRPASNGAAYSQPQAPTPQGLTMPMPGGQPTTDPRIKPEPGVKIEPGLDNASAMPRMTPMPQVHQQNGELVQDRVVAQLQRQFGDRAAATINRLTEQPANGSQAQAQTQAQQAAMAQQYARGYQGNAQQQQQYRPNMPPMGVQQQQHQQQQQQPRPTMPNGHRPPQSQMDGTGDDGSHIGVLLRQGAAGQSTELGRVEIDGLLHAQIAARASAMEGGGLMVPLKRSRKDKSKSLSNHREPAADAGPSQLDGGEDDVKDEESNDEDAINSDLDDSDDNVEENDDDEEAGQIMLCMYDKVQRVKNKWKCVLKDGVLNVNGKDYVFHKATGEYEW